jgi:hypothetical protein
VREIVGKVKVREKCGNVRNIVEKVKENGG